MSVRLSFLLVAALGAPPATAQTAEKSNSVDPKEQKVCRREVVTGSIRAKSVCKTREEWRAIGEQNDRDNEAFRNRPQSRPGSNGLE